MPLSASMFAVLLLLVPFSVARPAGPDIGLYKRALPECPAGTVLVGWHGTTAAHKDALQSKIVATSTAADLQLDPGFYVAQSYKDAKHYAGEAGKQSQQTETIICAICAEKKGFDAIKKVRVTDKGKWWNAEKIKAIGPEGRMLFSEIDGQPPFDGSQFVATQAHVTSAKMKAVCGPAEESEDLVVWRRYKYEANA